MLTYLRELPWRVLAYICTRHAVTRWLKKRAFERPYTHLYHRGELYMGRWWVFNPYREDAEGKTLPARWSWLPSVRLHHISQPDTARHLHDHPWNARTIILSGWYMEELEDGTYQIRERGYTGRILHGQYHAITHLHGYGAWTLFFTWRYRDGWGFKVDGEKVPHREYKARFPEVNA